MTLRMLLGRVSRTRGSFRLLASCRGGSSGVVLFFWYTAVPLIKSYLQDASNTATSFPSYARPARSVWGACGRPLGCRGPSSPRMAKMVCFSGPQHPPTVLLEGPQAPNHCLGHGPRYCAPAWLISGHPGAVLRHTAWFDD